MVTRAKKRRPEKAAFFVTIGLEGVDEPRSESPGVRRCAVYTSSSIIDIQGVPSPEVSSTDPEPQVVVNLYIIHQIQFKTNGIVIPQQWRTLNFTALPRVFPCVVVSPM